jgi:hypothetical protein
MNGGTFDERTEVIRELQEAADDFADRALSQEARRDGAPPGTGAHHQFAHSATLWRTAESRLRTRIQELELESAAQLLAGVTVPDRLTRRRKARHPAA